MQPFRLVLVVGGLVLLVGSAAARGQSSPTMQTVGIPGSVSLRVGDSVTFTDGSRSLTVMYGVFPGGTLPGFSATVTDDDTFLTFELPDQRFVQVNYPSSYWHQCTHENGRSNAVRCTIAASVAGESITFSAVRGVPTFPCPDVDLPAGWSLVSGGFARDINTNIGPFYTYQPSEGQYQAITDTGELQDTVGYWVYFAQPTAVFDLDVGNHGACFEASPFYGGPAPTPVNFGLTPSQWVMIGNPFLRATVTGADGVWTFDPMNGYQETQMLGLGQGAWVYSANGSTVTVTPTGP